MIQICKAGDAVKIRVLLFDGEEPKAGKTVNIAIERLSDGKFWDGNSFETAYDTVSMTDRFGETENDHNEGLYEYEFTTEATETQYDWSVIYNDGDLRRQFRGRIVTDSDHMTDSLPELSGLIGATASPKEVLTAWLMLFRNLVEVTDSQLSITNNAGTTIMKSTISDNGTTYAKAEMVAGP